MDIIKAIEKEYAKENVNEFSIGDTVNVSVKIKEGNRERIQVFEGVVIKRQNPIDPGAANDLISAIKRADKSSVEKTFLSILYLGMISNPPPTPDVERMGIPAMLIASISR